MKYGINRHNIKRHLIIIGIIVILAVLAYINGWYDTSLQNIMNP